MQEISTITIGLALLGFVLGAVIVALANQSRARRQSEAHEAQLHRLREEERKRERNLELLHQSQAEIEAKLLEAQRASEAQERESEILRAQFAEEQESAYGLEDRLNAAEARVLTLEAELGEYRRQLGERVAELQRHALAHDQLKAAHRRLAEAHFQSRSQRDRLVSELEGRVDELEHLQVHLDALQTTVAALLHAPIQLTEASTQMQEDGSQESTAIVPAQLQQIALAKAEVQAALRQRDQEVTELRSQLASMRYSLNVLTASGAALASMLEESAAESERGREPETTLVVALPRRASISHNLDAVTEQLASLEGIIADWFADLSTDMPYAAELLHSFAGAGVADRFGAPPNELAGSTALRIGQDADRMDAQVAALMRLAEDEDARLDDAELEQLLAEGAASLAPDVMLAAIKAANVAALRRNEARQNELLSALAEANAQIEQLYAALAQDSAFVLGEPDATRDEDLDAEESQEGAESDADGEADATAEAEMQAGEAEAIPALQTANAASAAPSNGEANAASISTRPRIPAGIPRADVPVPSVPRPNVPAPTAPGPAAAEATNLRSAWGKFVRRVGNVINRPQRRR